MGGPSNFSGYKAVESPPGPAEPRPTAGRSSGYKDPYETLKAKYSRPPHDR